MMEPDEARVFARRSDPSNVGLASALGPITNPHLIPLDVNRLRPSKA